MAEVERHLSGRGVSEELCGEVLEVLRSQGYLDDASFAHRFAADRRTLDHWGRERIERRLTALGVSPELIAAALVEQDAEQELDSALALLRRRSPEPPRDDRGRARALGLLLRRGYELELAHEAVRAYARGLTAATQTR